MLLIISLIIVSLFIYFLKDSLKKHAGIYYIGAAVISIAVFLIGFLPMPLFLKNNILGIFAKGSLGTAMFVAVMYAGALPKGSKLIAPLMKIRGELSITAAILVLCHNFTYGMTYFRMLFTKTSLLSATQLAAAVISLVLIAIMLVLTVTSFPSVRKKMKAKKWKQLQRTAYQYSICKTWTWYLYCKCCYLQHSLLRICSYENSKGCISKGSKSRKDIR